MIERKISAESFPLNLVAEEIGLVLSQTDELAELRTIKTPYGPLQRIGEPRAKREKVEVPFSHQHKKHLFEGKIEVLNLPIVVIHYTDPFYVQDPEFFKRAYENSRDVSSGRATPFTERKLAPWLYGCHEETMTLITERATRDLEFYYHLNNELRIKGIIRKVTELLRSTWNESKEDNEAWPRYIAAFLVPEYDYLREKELSDYLADPATIDLYRNIQGLLRSHLELMGRSPFPRGFGFPDVKASNLVEDEKGNILFIDVAKPAIAYHWLTLLGQFYQAVAKKAPNSTLAKILRERTSQILKAEPDQELAVQLFALGRTNRLLISCTLRNISYVQEIGLPIDEEATQKALNQVGTLTKTTSIEAVTEYN